LFALGSICNVCTFSRPPLGRFDFLPGSATRHNFLLAWIGFTGGHLFCTFTLRYHSAPTRFHTVLVGDAAGDLFYSAVVGFILGTGEREDSIGATRSGFLLAVTRLFAGHALIVDATCNRGTGGAIDVHTRRFVFVRSADVAGLDDRAVFGFILLRYLEGLTFSFCFIAAITVLLLLTIRFFAGGLGFERRHPAPRAHRGARINRYALRRALIISERAAGFLGFLALRVESIRALLVVAIQFGLALARVIGHFTFQASGTIIDATGDIGAALILASIIRHERLSVGAFLVAINIEKGCASGILVLICGVTAGVFGLFTAEGLIILHG